MEISELRLLYKIISLGVLASIALSLGAFIIAATDNMNEFSIAIGVLQVFLAVAAGLGFWAVRGAAKEKAGEVAEAVAIKTTENYFEKEEFRVKLNESVNHSLGGDVQASIYRMVDNYIRANDDIADENEDDDQNLGQMFDE